MLKQNSLEDFFKIVYNDVTGRWQNRQLAKAFHITRRIIKREKLLIRTVVLLISSYGPVLIES